MCSSNVQEKNVDDVDDNEALQYVTGDVVDKRLKHRRGVTDTNLCSSPVTLISASVVTAIGLDGVKFSLYIMT